MSANETVIVDETLAPATPVALADSPENFPESLQAVLLIYDIPSNVRYPNPSGRLRRIGFRENKSCWVIPAGHVPHNLINDLRTKGKANVELIRFDASEGPRLCRLAVDRMRREVAEQAARAAASIATAEANHLNLDADEMANNEMREDAIRRYNQQCKWVLERVEKLCRDVEIAIKKFGVNPNLLDLATTRNAMEVLQTGYKNRSAAYVAAVAELATINTPEAQALAKAAANDENAVPAEIIADMLRDNGNDAAADAIQNAFVPPANDDTTFSLVSDDTE